MVGIELGVVKLEATRVHALPRLAKAALTVERLRAPPVPTAIAAHLWRSTVLAQALYGCEIRQYPARELAALGCQARAVVSTKEPLCLSNYRAAEAARGQPLGACAVADPRWEALTRRLRWLVVLCNLPGLVGTVHRVAGFTGLTWFEPSLALRQAAALAGWQANPNRASLLAPAWPHLLPEPKYAGEVCLSPLASPPPSSSAWTDGSVQAVGGAAVIQHHPWACLQRP